jgi:hypothetical protein
MTRSFCSSASRRACACLVYFSLYAFSLASLCAAEIPPKKFAVMASATVQDTPPQITLSWPADSDATGYTINRRQVGAPAWSEVGTLPGGATSFTDGNVLVGERYEYQFIKSTSAAYTGYGYIQAGIRAPVADYFGKVLLVVENSIAGPLAGELSRLEADLTADGWVVLRRGVSVNDSPAAVKQVIKAAYDSDPGAVRGLFLFGHVPVPYSGDIAPDGHANHKGAWPADVFYGDMDGVWTDGSVVTTNAERQVNWNLPGDGKYDQSEIPSAIELMVGRVDLHNMTCFANKPFSRSEVDLLRQYLNKNHAFRWGEMAVERRALVCDNFSDKGSDPIGGSAWRNFPAFVGANQIQEVPWDGYFPAATSGSYLWSYASGGGSYYYSMGVGTSDDFALQDVRVVFTMFMGSYFGDWNNESNFIRASLGSGNVLASSYSGFPHSLYFPSGLGEPIGYGMMLSQNNGPGGLYPPWNQGTWQVHVSLQGDPTLRLFPVKPAANLAATTEPGTARLSWAASPDSGILGYNIYRAPSAQGPFQKVNASPISGTIFSDTPGTGTHHYMVRAVKLEQSGSGTFLNPSPGVTVQTTISGSVIQSPNAPVLSLGAVTDTTVVLNWADLPNETGYRLEARLGATGNWAEIATPAANVTTHQHTGVTPGATVYYRLRAFNTAGTSPYSAEVSATTQVPIPGTPALQLTSTTHNQVSLRWNDVANETGYLLERRIGQGAWAQLATPGANATSYIDTSVTPTTEYYYRLKAKGTYGDSAYSAEVLAYTQAPPAGPPAIPVLQAAALAESAIRITWLDLADELGYRLEARTPGGTWNEISTPAANSTSYQHTGLPPASSYEYRMRAYNAQGFSGYSEIVSAMTQSPPLQVPATPLLTSSGSTHAQIYLEWTDVAGATGYKLERKGGGSADWTEISSLAAGVTTFSDSGLNASTTYAYRIRAFNEAGPSSYSGELSVTTQAPPLQPPAQPTLAGTVTSHTAVNLNWGSVANAADYRLERRLASGNTWTEIARIPAGTSIYGDSGLSASTSYTYRLRAFNSAGFSAYSDELTLTTQPPPLQPPTVPVLQAQSVSHAEVALNWNAIANETGFTLQRRAEANGAWVTIAQPAADSTTFADTEVLPSTAYAYRIEASNAAGSSGYSAEVTVTTPATPVVPPAAPALSASAVSSTEVRLTWNDVATETSYVLERKTDGASSWTELSRPSANIITFNDTPLAPDTTYFYRIRAVNTGGESAWSEASARTHASLPQVESSATFVRMDAQTSGLWPLEFGADGTWIATQTPMLPENIAVTVASGTPVTWEENSTQSRALIGITGTNRVAAGWSGEPLSLNLNIPRGTPRRMALYFVDWNRLGATQEISIRDANTATNLDTRSIDQFGDGKYVVYDLEGNVTITISSPEGPVVLSGIFFGQGVPAPISDRPLTFTVLGAERDGLRVRISGDSGQRFKVQTTPDLQNWSDLATSIMVGGSTELTVRGLGGDSFFRTVNTP